MLGLKRSRSTSDISIKDESPRKLMKTDENLSDTREKEKLKEKICSLEKKLNGVETCNIQLECLRCENTVLNELIELRKPMNDDVKEEETPGALKLILKQVVDMNIHLLNLLKETKTQRIQRELLMK